MFPGLVPPVKAMVPPDISNVAVLTSSPRCRRTLAGGLPMVKLLAFPPLSDDGQIVAALVPDPWPGEIVA